MVAKAAFAARRINPQQCSHLGAGATQEDSNLAANEHVSRHARRDAEDKLPHAVIDDTAMQGGGYFLFLRRDRVIIRRR